MTDIDTEADSTESRRLAAQTVHTRGVIQALFGDMGAGKEPSEIAQRFSPDVDWKVSGNETIVPWLGKKHGREGVAEFFQQLRDNLAAQDFKIDRVVVDGDSAIAVGSSTSQVLATGKGFETDVALDMVVRDGLVVRFRMFEDSFAVSEAVRPDE
jgi:ketosteroid isomerase-like protein